MTGKSIDDCFNNAIHKLRDCFKFTHNFILLTWNNGWELNTSLDVEEQIPEVIYSLYNMYKDLGFYSKSSEQKIQRLWTPEELSLLRS